MTRLLINDGIKQKAEEDLSKLLMGKNLEPNSFNYSPFILRCINEKLLEKGYSIGLGVRSKKEIIDNYWNDLILPLGYDVILRMVDNQTINQSQELIILIKDNITRNKIWNELYNIKTIRPKNDRIIRGTTSIFDKNKMDDQIKDIEIILKKHSLNYVIEYYEPTREKISLDNIKFDLVLPPDISFSCKRCNMCELPSNYSVNPIPNRCEQPFSELLSSERIGFPSNMVSISVSEVKEIASALNKELEEFTQPILLVKRKTGEIADFQLALKQNDGICVFQNLKAKHCTIHDIRPLNCQTYPFMISPIENDHFLIEVDYSCPGIAKEGINFKNHLLNDIKTKIFKKNEPFGKFSENELNNWDFSEYFSDGTRVSLEDIKEAVRMLEEDFDQC